MSNSDALATPESFHIAQPMRQKRQIARAIWQPFLQYRILFYLLGGSILVASALGSFMLFALSDIINTVSTLGKSNGYYGEMVGKEMINILRYCGALFSLYVILLAAICITYTHKVASPIKPINRHIDALIQGNYIDRLTLRKNDLPMIKEQVEKLNALAAALEKQ